MPVLATHLTTSSSGTDATSYTTASISPTADRLVLVAVYGGNDTAGSPEPTVTGAGMTWVTVLTNPAVTDSGQRITVFRGLSASPGSGALTIDFGVTEIDRCSWSITEFENVDLTGTNGSGAVVQSVANDADATTSLTVTLAAFGSTDNATYGAISLANNTAITQGTGFTELGEADGPEAGSIESQWRNDNDTSVDWSFASSNHIVGIAVEIKFSLLAAGRRNYGFFM